MAQHKKIAAITMVRNDDFFLRKWVEYYGRELGMENLYVFFDGTDQIVPDFCQRVNASLEEKIGTNVVAAEKGRLAFLSHKAEGLFREGYDLVIGCDADEYLVVDPKTGKDLKTYLSEAQIDVTLSGLGLDFGQKTGPEGDLSNDRPYLSQRKYAQIGTRYTKAAVVARPCVWGSGFHRVKGHNFHIGRDLYMLHFGYSDLRIIEGRLSDKDRTSQGWQSHIRKRSRTIRLVNSLPVRSFDKWTSIARRIETLVRPPYAWNKPGLLGLRIVIEIPSRFREIL